jgi:hypothetical protein
MFRPAPPALWLDHQLRLLQGMAVWNDEWSVVGQGVIYAWL